MRNPQLVIEQRCDHGMLGRHPAGVKGCDGGARTVIDPELEIHLDAVTGRGFDCLVSDVLDALLAEEDR